MFCVLLCGAVVIVLHQMKGEKLDGLFEDDAWKMLFHHVISSSNCGNPALRLFGFGPVSAEGFGKSSTLRFNSVTEAFCCCRLDTE